jgi:hypothetical protein
MLPSTPIATTTVAYMIRIDSGRNDHDEDNDDTTDETS